MAEIKMYLTLTGDDFDLDYVTKKIGMRPDNVRHKDEVLGNGKCFGHNEWGIASEKLTMLDLDDFPDKFISKIPCGTDMLSSVANEVNAEWHILFLVEVYDDFPSIYFSAEFIKFAADIGAQIGFDTYLYLNYDDDDES